MTDANKKAYLILKSISSRNNQNLFQKLIVSRAKIVRSGNNCL